MLGRKVISHPRVIDNGQPDQSFLPGPRQGGIHRQKNGEAAESDQKREHNETDRLSSQKPAVRFGTISEISTAEPVPNPKQRGQAKVEKNERTGLWVGISVAQP